jgi:muramidase (phage lysozyme)
MDRTIPRGAQILLDFIGDTEAPKGYGTIYANKQSKLPKPLTSMTIGEVIDAQKAWSKNNGSSAAGRYQFMRATLIDLSKTLNLSGKLIFNADLQDQLGYELLNRRGYSEFIAGKINSVEFGKRLAQEWASFPVLTACKGAHRTVQRGETYYAGDKLNKALVEPSKVEQILLTVRKAPDPAPSPDIGIPTSLAKPAPDVVDAQKTAGVPFPPKQPEREPEPVSGGKGLLAGVLGILAFVAAFWATVEGWWAHAISFIQGVF